MFNIVLLEPEIPLNTGNIGRTVVATKSRLHLIRPLGFKLDETSIKRAGLDYWDKLDVQIYDNLEDFCAKNKDASFNYLENKKEIDSNVYFATTKATKTYCDVSYKQGDYIMFGKESAGIREEILSKNKESCIRIPMEEDIRSLNLSNSVAIVLYEALRQNKFSNLLSCGHLHNLEWQ